MSQTTSPQEGEGNATSVIFQLVFIALTSFVLILSVHHLLVIFKSADKMPELYTMTPDRALEFGGIPTGVRVGMQLTSFPVYDFVSNNFTFTGTIWFEIDPNLTSIDTISNFSFDKGDIKYKSEPITRIIKDKLLARFFVKVEFKSNINQKYFPLGDHTIYLVVDNFFLSPSEVYFTSSLNDFTVSQNIATLGWEEFDRHVNVGYSIVEELSSSALNTQAYESQKEKISYHPRAIFSIDYSLKATRRIIIILFPLVLIFFVTIFTFAIDPKKYFTSILALSTASVTALITYRFVIENLSPKVGYFMLSDWLFFLFFFLCFIIFFLNTETLKISKEVKEYVTASMHLIVIISVIYLFNFW